MNAPHRGALMLVRFVGAALIGLSLVEVSLDWLESAARHAPLEVSRGVLPAIALVIGLVILIKAGAIAEWISEKLDD
jgi:hypothetical protein